MRDGERTGTGTGTGQALVTPTSLTVSLSQVLADNTRCEHSHLLVLRLKLAHDSRDELNAADNAADTLKARALQASSGRDLPAHQDPASVPSRLFRCSP